MAGKKADYVGQKFGPWTVIARTDRKDTNRNCYWLVECDCEYKTQKEITAECLKLTRGDKCRCDTLQADLMGQTFERLTVIKAINDYRGNRKGWLCECSCGSGKEVKTNSYELLNGRNKSCGCLNDERRRMTGEEANGWRGGRHYADGYVRVYAPDHANATKSGYVFEHVKVMSDHIGRPLKKEETVHHIFGVKDDNRIECLELWSSAHPPGQRITDKIVFAKEILELYLTPEEILKWAQTCTTNIPS